MEERQGIEEKIGNVDMTIEQQNINTMAQNMKYLTNRLVNTEMALDVFLGIMFDKTDGEALKQQFEDLFKERMETIRKQYEEQEKKQAEAMARQGVVEPPKEEENVIINP